MDKVASAYVGFAYFETIQRSSEAREATYAGPPYLISSPSLFV